MKNIWKTINAGLVDNWDFNIIYKILTERKNIYHWCIVPTPECLEWSDVDTVLHAFFYCPKTKHFIKQAELIFQETFRPNI